MVGSITPDLGYYVHNWVWSISGHSFLGSITFDIPAGLILLMLFYLTIRPISRLLPYPHREACSAICPVIKLPSLAALFTAAFSILVGAWTHIIWDGFTHANGWCVREFAALTPTLFTLYGYNVTIWQTLQHASSIFGLGVLAWVYFEYAYGKRYLKHRDFLSNQARTVLLSLLMILPAVYSVAKCAGIMHNGFSIPRLDVFTFNATVMYVCILLPLLAVSGIIISLLEYIMSQTPRRAHLAVSQSNVLAHPLSKTASLAIAGVKNPQLSSSAEQLSLPIDSARQVPVAE